MSSHTAGSGDPNAGKHILWVVAGIGLAAVVGYAVVEAGRAARAPDYVAPAAAVDPTPPASIPELVSAVEGARDDLDVSALMKLEEQLARAAQRTTMKRRELEARLARLDALSTRALEAAVRARQGGEDGRAAERIAETTITQGRRALANLRAENSDLDAARMRAAEARLALASGEDITATHPVVLLPTFRDTELRLAALSRPVWFERDPSDDEVVEVVEELGRSPARTALTRNLLAVALHETGDDEAALAELETVLSRTPSQPLALAIRRSLTAPVAVADPPPTVGDDVPAPVAEPVPVESDPEPAPEPIPDPTPAPPDPEPDPAPTPAKPEATPEPARVPETPPPSKPEATKPKPEDPRPKPKPAATAPNFDALVAGGCDKVHSGDAQQGLDELRKAFDIQPGSTKVTLCMAEGHAKLGRDASARALVDRVLRGSPRNVKARLLAASLAERSGNSTAALEHYRVVLEVEPANAKAKAYVDKNG